MTTSDPTLSLDVSMLMSSGPDFAAMGYAGSGLAGVVHTLPGAVLFTDMQLRCTYLNVSAEQFIGITLADVQGRLLSGILDDMHVSVPSSESDTAPIVGVLTSHPLVEGQAVCITQYPDGVRVPVAFIACAIREGSSVVGISIALHERREAHPAHGAHVTEQAPACIATLRGSDHVFEMANPAYYDLVGHRDIIGKPMGEALPEIVAQGFITLLDTVYQTGTPYVATQRTMLVQRGLSGALEERVLNFVYSPLYAANDRVAGILVHAVDITDTIRAQAQFALMEAHYRYLVATLPQTIYVLDPQGRFTEVNPAGEHLLGRSSIDLVGSHFQDVVSVEDHPQAIQAFIQVITTVADNIELELHITRPTGEQRLIQVTATALWEHGQIAGLYGIARDITDERARDEQMRLLTLVLEQIEHGVTVLDADLHFRFINPAAAKLLGIVADMPYQYTLDQFIPDEGARDELTETFAHLHATGQWSGRVRRRRLSDGHVRLFDMVQGGVVAANGARLYFDLFQDASNVVEQERQLRRAERLASLGTLIGGVAHELNNPLTTIVSLCELLLLDPGLAHTNTELTMMHHEAERMARIVADLRLSARHTQEYERAKGPVDLNTVVQHGLKIRAYTLQTSNITVHEDLADDLPAVYGDAGQLEQVLLNLIVNAEQAMQETEGSHHLVLRTSRTALGASLQVIDNGSGIAPQHLERLFDPFFTTKAPGEGTGLGLALVHSLVQEHGGTLHVESTPGSGTVFRVDLRAAEYPFFPTEVEDIPPPSRSLRILVVDDETPIREVLTRFLTQRGHYADTATDGHAALQCLDLQAYDCIISDLRMPGMDGEHLFMALQQRGLGSQLIVVTGDATSDALTRILQVADVPVLLKPISPWNVAWTIERHADGDIHAAK